MKSTTMLPAVIVNASVKPKPTKKEIIEALTMLRVEELQTENLANNTRRARLASKIRPMVIRLMKANMNRLAKIKNFGTARSSWNSQAQKSTPSGGWQNLELVMDMDYPFEKGFKLEIPVALETLLQEYNSIPAEHNLRDSDEEKIRRTIAFKLANQSPSEDRVQALIDSPATRAALTTMLAGITGTKIIQG